MTFVITLIAKDRLPSGLVGTIAYETGARNTKWLRPLYACDLEANGTMDQLYAKTRQVIKDAPVDVIVQKPEDRRKKLLLADMDSTIVTSETLDELAEYAGVGHYVAAITERAMNGEIDFKAALAERVMLLKNLPEITLEDVWQKTILSDGAETLVKTMKKHDAYCVLISGGFSYFTNRVRDVCGFDRDISNELEVLNHNLTGAVLPPIVDKDAKLNALKDIAEQKNMDVSEALTVGDGANDIPMLKGAGLGIAYRGRPAVRDQIPHQLNYADLTGLLYAQGYSYSEFIK